MSLIMMTMSPMILTMSLMTRFLWSVRVPACAQAASRPGPRAPSAHCARLATERRTTTRPWWSAAPAGGEVTLSFIWYTIIIFSKVDSRPVRGDWRGGVPGPLLPPWLRVLRLQVSHTLHFITSQKSTFYVSSYFSVFPSLVNPTAVFDFSVSLYHFITNISSIAL